MVIDPDALEEVHSVVEERYGESDRGARSPGCSKMIVTTTNGEYGPVISWKETIAERKKRKPVIIAAKKPRKKQRRVAKPSWKAKTPNGSHIPDIEARPTNFSEEFLIKVCDGAEGKGGHLFGNSPTGEKKKTRNTEFPEPWTRTEVADALRQTLEAPDIEFAGKGAWRFYRKKVGGVIVDLRYSYSRKHNKATLNYFIPTSGTIENGGKEYHVRVLLDDGYHDVPLNLEDLEGSGII